MKRYNYDEERAYGEIKVDKPKTRKVTKKNSEPTPTTDRKYTNSDGGYVDMDDDRR